ncbi:MAG: hypothetical protein IPN79_12855 [Saprospiraceae bacterium]|nr:hypothetical protein [Saprospiraceae bacterium]
MSKSNLLKIKHAKWGVSRNPVNAIGAEFLANDISAVLAQTSCVSVGVQGRFIEKYTNPNNNMVVIYDLDRYFIVGKKADGTWLDGDENLIAAPCPDICVGEINGLKFELNG